MSRIAVGTVQFGIDYGVSNQHGKVSPEEVQGILEFCAKNKIETLDTAQSYGESEKVLGRYDLSKFKVITKLPENGHLEESLEKLNLDRVHAVLFHREGEVNDDSYLKLENYKKQQMTDKIGVSVYSPARLHEIINRYDIDIVQVPLNLLDRRFEPILPELKAKGIEIHSRSAFLQGLLLMEDEDVPRFFEEIKPILSKIKQPKLHQAIGFVKSVSYVDKIVVGCTSVCELREIVRSYEDDSPLIDSAGLSIDDERYINPSNWMIRT